MVIANSTSIQADLAPPEDRLRDNIKGLIDLCRDIIADAADKGFGGINIGLIDVAALTLAKWNQTELINDFIDKSHEYWDKIRLREENFFRSNMATIFANVPLIDMGAVAGLFDATQPGTTELLVPKEDRDAVWDFLTAMVKICIKYIHNERKPCVRKVGDTYKPFYQREFFPNIRLEQHAKQWDIKLEFSVSR